MRVFSNISSIIQGDIISGIVSQNMFIKMRTFGVIMWCFALSFAALPEYRRGLTSQHLTGLKVER